MEKMIVSLSVAETCKILTEHGLAMSPVHLRAGIECGAYPFGVCIIKKTENARPSYEIYRPLLMRWIEERSEIKS